jgi:hypothetical protein
MSSPYGPPGGNDPQGWGQQPSYGGGPYQNPSSGGFPVQPGGPNTGGYPQQQPGGYGQQPPVPQPGYGQQPVPGYGAPEQQQPYQGYGQQPSQQQYPGQFGQQAQQPYGGYQTGGFPGDQSGPRKRTGLIWTLVVVVVVIAAAVAVLGFVWPGWFNKQVLDTSSVQDGVKNILQNDYKINVSTVTCPPDPEVKVGNTFYCQATIGGQQKQVQVTVKTTDGQYEVGQPK